VPRVTGVSGVCAIESPLCEWLPQTVFSVSRVLFSLYDNHHHSIHRITSTLQSSYHLRSGPLLTTLASRQPHSGACTAAVIPAHDQTSIRLNPEPPQMVIIFRTQTKPYYGTRTTQPSAPSPHCSGISRLKEACTRSPTKLSCCSIIAIYQ